MPPSTVRGVIELDVAISGGSAILVLLLVADGENINPPPLLGALALTVWWTSPLAAYAAKCRTTAGSVVLGVVYVSAAIVFLQAIFASTSSTAAIGLFTVPVLLWGGMVAGLILEALIKRWTEDRTRQTT